jgi:hypothetical protein
MCIPPSPRSPLSSTFLLLLNGKYSKLSFLKPILIRERAIVLRWVKRGLHVNIILIIVAYMAF